LAAAELVWITIYEVGSDTDSDEHLGDGAKSIGGVEFGLMDTQRFVDDFTDCHPRVEARERILKHDLKLTTQRLQLAG
jgi:hypothetical protein